MKGSLTVVGTGIQAIAQTSEESAAYIRDADKVFLVCADPLTEYWVHELNTSSELLNYLYEPGRERRETYKQMVERVMKAVESGLDVCFALYGHPAVLADPPHEAVRRARASGFSAKMLPAISADACLFADLEIDPGKCGYQSFEATDFLTRHRRFDPRSALVLWQIGVIGESGYKAEMGIWNRNAVRVLTDVLLQHYPGDHVVTVYEAARYPCCTPLIANTELAQLPEAPISSIATLYVPPFGVAELDEEMLERLRASV